MIRIVIVLKPEFAQPHEQVRVSEFEDGDPAADDLLRQAAHQLDVDSVSLQRVDDWSQVVWSQLVAGCEVRSEADGSTWVVSRALNASNPHEVEIYRFDWPEERFTFTPLYNAPVWARMTHESSMMALLMTELGAKVIDS